MHLDDMKLVCFIILVYYMFFHEFYILCDFSDRIWSQMQFTTDFLWPLLKTSFLLQLYFNFSKNFEFFWSSLKYLDQNNSYVYLWS